MRRSLAAWLFARFAVSKNVSLWDLEPSWGPDGCPDSQNHQNYLQNYKKSTYFGSKVRQSTHSCPYYTIQTMFFATIFAGRVPILRERNAHAGTVAGTAVGIG